MSVGRPYFAMPYPGLFRITCDLPFPGLSHVHVYAARGPQGGLVLFDASLGMGDSWDRIDEGIRWLGRSWSDVETVYITHAHPDHVGLAAHMQETSGAPVVCHPIAHRMLELMGQPGRWAGMHEQYREHGWDPPEAPEADGRGFEIGVPARIRHLEEGDEVRFAGSSWDVHWTPGHEWGHIVFHRPADGVILVGDTLLGKITPNISFHGEPPDPLGQFLDSLDKIAALAPAFVVPGHGRSFDDGRERARAIRAHHEARLRRMTEVLMRRGPLVALEVSRAVFGRDLMFFEDRLALAETLAHLEYLRLRGRLEREMSDGVWRYGLSRTVVP